MCCRTCPPFSVIPAGVGGDLSGESRMDSPLPTTAGAGSTTVGNDVDGDGYWTAWRVMEMVRSLLLRRRPKVTRSPTLWRSKILARSS